SVSPARPSAHPMKHNPASTARVRMSVVLGGCDEVISPGGLTPRRSPGKGPHTSHDIRDGERDTPRAGGAGGAAQSIPRQRRQRFTTSPGRGGLSSRGTGGPPVSLLVGQTCTLPPPPRGAKKGRLQIG